MWRAPAALEEGANPLVIVAARRLSARREKQP